MLFSIHLTTRSANLIYDRFYPVFCQVPLIDYLRRRCHLSVPTRWTRPHVLFLKRSYWAPQTAYLTRHIILMILMVLFWQFFSFSVIWQWVAPTMTVWITYLIDRLWVPENGYWFVATTLNCEPLLAAWLLTRATSLTAPANPSSYS